MLESERLPLEIPDDPVEGYLNSLIDHSPQTVKTYRSVLKALRKLLNPVPLDLATMDELFAALKAFSKRYSAPTFSIVKAALRGFLRHVGRDDLIPRIPNRPLRWTPKKGPTSVEIDRALREANPEDTALVLTLYSTGLRIGELLSARVEDVDWESGKIEVTEKGGGRACAVFFLRRIEAMEALANHIKRKKENDPIFDMTPTTAWRRLRKLGRRVGVKMAPHLLRHSCAQSMRRQGLGLFEVNAQLRHRTLKATLAYEKLDRAELISEAEKREWR